ncbi:LysR family transcriptional regulator [Kiloniella antarctica]|uniref:LysR family transcriptional regulator n=1 Tax=Kiloniella antarctica TaxID=1550907 RepID=A0ABW5BLI1_9PROT
MTFDPSLTALYALKSLMGTGSVSQTATELGLTQSAVSRSIAGLEKMVGLTLVRRGLRPLDLTEEGRVVVAHAQDIIQSLSSLDDRLSALRRNKAGSVQIGSFGASASTRLLPPLLMNFAKPYPAISVNIQEATDAETLQNLQRNLVDMAVLADPGAEYDVVPLAIDRLVALVPESSPLEKQIELQPEDFLGAAFIMTLGGSEPAITSWFGDTMESLAITQRVQQTHSILALVRAKLGNAIVAALSLPEETQGIARIPLAQAPTTDIVLARKSLEPKSKAAGLFWKFVEKK